MKNYNIEYYDKNAEKFFESTVGVDFKEEQERFLKYLKREIGRASCRERV